jgi:F-box/WD-40 domain protein 7
MQHEDAATPPADFLCLISQQLMVEPAILVETGHSYEAANIRRWLDTRDTCPMSRQQLRSKQLVPNWNLKSAVVDWAASHAVSMPAAPTYTSMHNSIGGPSAVTAVAAGGSEPDVAAGADQRERPAAPNAPSAAAAGKGGPSAPSGELGQRKSNSDSPFILNLPSDFADKGAGRSSKSGAMRCTRTRWALGLSALLLIAAGVATGLGVNLTVGRNKQGERVSVDRFPSPEPRPDAVITHVCVQSSLLSSTVCCMV